MSGVIKQTIKSLTARNQNSLIVGVIIGSLNMRTFDATRSKFYNGERGVWTFTLKDTVEDFINVTVWGSVEHVCKLSSTFHIGSVVEVINAKVVERCIDDKKELYVPSVSSPYSLTLNEDDALVQSHDTPTAEEYLPLLAMPTRPINEVRSLKSIIDDIESYRDQYINLLVVVTFIGDIRNVITRDRREMKCRSFEITDDSTDETVSLMLWEQEWIEKARHWQLKHTVLFLADARVMYDKFKKGTFISLVRKTLITENPDIAETAAVRATVKSYTAENMCSIPFAIPDLRMITNVMTIQEITNRINKKPVVGVERLQFATITKATVTDINAGSLSPNLIIIRWWDPMSPKIKVDTDISCMILYSNVPSARCKRIVKHERDSCMNLDCPFGNGSNTPFNIVSLNLKVNLKDETGYLIGCRLCGEAAERVLNCSVQDFQSMTLPEREDLKWKYLLEKCNVFLHVLGPSSVFPQAAYNILTIERVREQNEEEEETVTSCAEEIVTAYNQV